MANPNYDQRAEAIYAAAKKQDEPALLAACKETGLRISRKVNNIFMCAITQVAYEGDRKAVGFLLRFGGKKEDAVIGAAIRGDEYLVQALLQLDVTAEQMLKNAIQGWAIGNHVVQVDEALSKIKESNNVVKYYQHIGAAIYGYALAGNVEQVNKWLAFINDPVVKEDGVTHKLDYKHLAAQAYTLGGFFTYADELLRRGAKVESVIEGYTRGGYIQEANACLEKALKAATTEKEKTKLRTLAGKHYALGGYTDQVNALIKEGADVWKILDYYALESNYSAAEALLRNKESIEQIKKRNHIYNEEYIQSQIERQNISEANLTENEKQLVLKLDVAADFTVDFTGKELTTIKQEIKRQFQPMLPRKDWIRFFQIKPYGVASAMLLDEIEKSKNIEELKHALTKARNLGREKKYSEDNPFMQAVNKMLGGVNVIPMTTPESKTGMGL